MPFRSSAIQTTRVGNSGFPMPAVRSGSTTTTSSSSSFDSSFDDDCCVVVIVVFGPTNRTDSNSPAPESKDGNTTKSPSNIPSHNSSSTALDFSDDAFRCGVFVDFQMPEDVESIIVFVGIICFVEFEEGEHGSMMMRPTQTSCLIGRGSGWTHWRRVMFVLLSGGNNPW